MSSSKNERSAFSPLQAASANMSESEPRGLYRVYAQQERARKATVKSPCKSMVSCSSSTCDSQELCLSRSFRDRPDRLNKKLLHDYTGREQHSVSFHGGSNKHHAINHECTSLSSSLNHYHHNNNDTTFARSSAGVVQFGSPTSIKQYNHNLPHSPDEQKTSGVCSVIRRRSDDLNTSTVHAGDNSSVWANASMSSLLRAQPQPPSILNKAVITLNAHDTKILIANDMVCKLLGVEASALIDIQLSDLIAPPAADRTLLEPPKLLDSSLLGRNGRLTPAYGKVMDVLSVDQSGAQSILPVSVWSFPIASTSTANQHTAALDMTNQDQALVEDNDDAKPTLDSHSETGEGDLDDSRWMVVLEPVERMTTNCTLGPGGRLFCSDEHLPEIFGYESVPEMLGTAISRLLPSLHVPFEQDELLEMDKEHSCHKQHTDEVPQRHFASTCALSKSGAAFPIICDCVAVCDEETGEPYKYDLSLSVYVSVSGVVTCLMDGTIHSYNQNFVNTLLGYHTGDQLRHRPVTVLVPKFYRDMEQVMGDEELPLPPFDGAHIHKNSASDDLLSRELSDLDIEPAQLADGQSRSQSQTPCAVKGMSECHRIVRTPSPCTTHSADQAHLFATSTPGGHVQGGQCSIHEGSYSGYARHAEGCLIAVCYQVKRLRLKDGTVLFSVWLHRDQQWSTTGEHSNQNGNINDTKHKNNAASTISSSSNRSSRDSSVSSAITFSFQHKLPNMPSTSASACTSQQSTSNNNNLINPRSPTSAVSSAVNSKRRNISTSVKQSASSQLDNTLNEHDMDEAVLGEYGQHYNTLAQIGRGAFGCVQLAARRDDDLLVITKFIRKDKVLLESWVLEPDKNGEHVRQPIEISLLPKLKQANIVRVLDVFENDTYYQLVMEKHGPGMDLFEFIDRRPQLDEALCSYMFRQLVAAVSYLNLFNIVHRDLKDENVIIDEHFQCKLIDFGSAAYFGDKKSFSTFCGTVEYCSPEVLLGNKYKGPELEIWSLGILLYTLVFGENPFSTVEETIRAELDMPEPVSESLEHLISWMLHPSVEYRATISELQQHWWLHQKVDITKYVWAEVVPNLAPYELHPPILLSQLTAEERHLLAGKK